jgi:hypothetical protein
MKNKTFTFDARWYRLGTIRIGTVNCDVCHENGVDGIAIDSSSDEYGEGAICLDCIKKETNDEQ